MTALLKQVWMDARKAERKYILNELVCARDLAFGTPEYYGLDEAVSIIEGLHHEDYPQE